MSTLAFFGEEFITLPEALVRGRVMSKISLKPTHNRPHIHTITHPCKQPCTNIRWQLLNMCVCVQACSEMHPDACSMYIRLGLYIKKTRVQDDWELREVANDLGIEVNVRSKETTATSLGQSYPIMDDPDSLPPPPPPALPPRVEDSQDPDAGASGDTGSLAHGQRTLEQLAACRFRPYRNQAIVRVATERSLRQTTLEDLPSLQPHAKVESAKSSEMHGVPAATTGPPASRSHEASRFEYGVSSFDKDKNLLRTCAACAQRSTWL